MPYYDFKCPKGCGYYPDVYVPLKEHGTTTCPSCSAVLETVISEVALIGPMPSKPLVVSHIGKTFESNSEFNEYQRKNPGWDILSPDSNAWKDHRDAAQEKAERTAKRQGYNDLEHKRSVRKEEKAKKAGKVDKKIYVH